MNYRVIRHKTEPDLEHGIFGIGGNNKKPGVQKGFQKQNHLYLARQWVKDKWRYAYTPEEVRAMQGYQKAKKAGQDAVTAVKRTVDNAGKAAKEFRNYSTDVDKREKTAATYESMYNRRANNSVDQIMKFNSDKPEIAREYLEEYHDARKKRNHARDVKESAQKEKESFKYKTSKAVDTALDKAEAVSKKGKDYLSDKVNKAKNVAEKAVSDAGDAINSGKDWAKNTAEKAKNAAKDAADVVTGKYAKDVDEDAALKRLRADTINQTSADRKKEIAQLNKDAKEDHRKATESSFRGYKVDAQNYAQKYEDEKARAHELAKQEASNLGAKNKLNIEARQAEKEKDSTKYKISNAVNSAKDAVDRGKDWASNKANKVSQDIKNYGADQKAKAEKTKHLNEEYKDAYETMHRVLESKGQDSKEYAAAYDNFNRAKDARDADRKTKTLNVSLDVYSAPKPTYKEEKKNDKVENVKVNRTYNGTSEKAQNPDNKPNVSKEYQEELDYNTGKSTGTRQTSSAPKGTPTAQRRDVPDEYWEAASYNSKKNDGSSDKTADRNNSYRQLSNEANRLGRATDRASDAVASAREQFGEDSKQYRDAVQKEKEAFAELRQVESQLKRLNQR